MIKFILISVFVLLFNSKAYSLELLMINSKNCVYCKKFLVEVASNYKISQLPIIIIDDYNKPEWFLSAYKEKKIKPYRGTPTFIIWNDVQKYEIDRIVGYMGKERFYNSLRDILEKFINEKELKS